MLKVLISDDEIKVCRLIEGLVNWQSLGIKVEGVVHDGLSALDFIRGHTVDIMITDIRMPGINGLDLIQEARRLDENLNFIVISGYNQFDYAQQAIKFGVEDYILKPIKKKELVACLMKIIKKREDAQKTEAEKESLMQRIHIDTEKVKITFLMELIEHNAKKNSSPDLEYVNTHYYCQFNQEYYQIMIIQPIFHQETMDEQLTSFLITKIKDLILTDFHFLPELIAAEKNEAIYCILNGSLDNLNAVKNQLTHLKNTILNLQDVVSKMKIYIFSSSINKGIEQLPACMREAVLASYDKLITFQSIIEFSAANEQPGIPDIITPAFRKDFLFAIETLDTERISQLIQAITKELHHSAISGKFIHDVYLELLDIYSFGIKAYKLDIHFDVITKCLEKDFHYQINIDDLMLHLTSRLNCSLSDYQAEKKQEISKPIRSAKQYINSNYMEPLTLEIIGNEVGLNPSYFSSAFKKETGSSFIDYLNDIRIDNAKPLLLKRHYTLIDICEMVGFNDIKYFKKRFKKSTGLSPTDYRRLYS